MTQDRLRSAGAALVIPAGALAAALVVFGLFMAALGRDPLEVYALIYRGAFASAFSWQNTLARAAPLVLTALCVALPARRLWADFEGTLARLQTESFVT